MRYSHLVVLGMSLTLIGCLSDDGGVKSKLDHTGCEGNTTIKESMLKAINQARSEGRSCGETYYEAVSPLGWNSKLTAAAQVHAEDMADYNFFSHTGSDGLGVVERVETEGYAWSAVGENIYAGSPTSAEAVSAWLDSPGHCANIMSTDFSELGAACVEATDSDYSYYWTQVLAQPAP